MYQSRRRFLISAAAVGSVTVLSHAGYAAGGMGDMFAASGGDIEVFPVAHASFVMKTPAGVIYADPVGDVAAYASLPAPDLILITHEHGDHYSAETLAAIMGDATKVIVNPAVFDKLPEALKARAEQIANGGATAFNGVSIDAIPAYNTTEGRTQFHPKGRDNGYVLGFEGLRVYISGDTEDIPDMRALKDIDLAFLCMNLPFTMDAAAAASAVAEFRPTYVYPYHYRGRDGGTQDPAEFARLVGGTAEVKMGSWYG